MGELFLDRYVYVMVVVLLAIGLYGMLASANLAKKIIGMVIFQSAIYLFFIEGSVKDGATAPVIDEAFGTDPDAYVNPLPHLLILTAIVVGVGVVGVAFALMMRVHQAYGTLDEASILEQLDRQAAAAKEAERAARVEAGAGTGSPDEQTPPAHGDGGGSGH